MWSARSPLVHLAELPGGRDPPGRTCWFDLRGASNRHVERSCRSRSASTSGAAPPASEGRSQAATMTARRALRRDRLSSRPSTPPSGPVPGYRSGRTSSPSGATPQDRRRRRAPGNTRRLGALRATRDPMAMPSTSTSALVLPMRRLDPPVRTAPITSTPHGARLISQRESRSGRVAAGTCGSVRLHRFHRSRRPFSEAAEGSQEPVVGRLGPPDVSAPPPPVRSKVSSPR